MKLSLIFTSIVVLLSSVRAIVPQQLISNPFYDNGNQIISESGITCVGDFNASAVFANIPYFPDLGGGPVVGHLSGLGCVACAVLTNPNTGATIVVPLVNFVSAYYEVSTAAMKNLLTNVSNSNPQAPLNVTVDITAPSECNFPS